MNAQLTINQEFSLPTSIFRAQFYEANEKTKAESIINKPFHPFLDAYIVIQTITITHAHLHIHHALSPCAKPLPACQKSLRPRKLESWLGKQLQFSAHKISGHFDMMYSMVSEFYQSNAIING